MLCPRAIINRSVVHRFTYVWTAQVHDVFHARAGSFFETVNWSAGQNIHLKFQLNHPSCVRVFVCVCVFNAACYCSESVQWLIFDFFRVFRFRLCSGTIELTFLFFVQFYPSRKFTFTLIFPSLRKISLWIFWG